MSRLAQLLRQRMRMLREDALAVANVVEEAFRGQSELDDDVLDPQLRQVFYDLQDENILKIRREEYTLEGRLLRGYFWSVENQPKLDQHAPPLRQPDPDEKFYSGLKDVAWNRRPPS